MDINQLVQENTLLSQQDLVCFVWLEVTVKKVFQLYVLLDQFVTKTALAPFHMIARKASIAVLAQLEFVQMIQDSIVTDAQLVITAQQVLQHRHLVLLAPTQMLEVIKIQANVTNVSKACIAPILGLYLLL